MDETAFHALSVDETLAVLKSSTQGLSSQEAERRLHVHGPNDLVSAKSRSRLAILLSQFKDLLVAVLIVAGFISFGIALVEGSWENYRNGTIIFLIVIADAALGFSLEYKASRIVRNLRTLILSPARVMRDQRPTETPLQTLVPGDVVDIEQGDKIPADMRVSESNNLQTNEFSLTGESTPVDKVTDMLSADLTVADRRNMVFAGTSVASGSGVGVVVHTGMRTELGKIAAMTEETIEVRSPLQDELNVLAVRLTVVAGAVSGVLFVLALWLGLGWLMAVTYALGVAVACVPQALPAQLIVAMSSASQHLARKKAVVKSLPTVEALGSTNVICTDKTGTLTRNEMTVTRAWSNEQELEFTGVGYHPEGEVLDETGNLVSEGDIQALSLLFRTAILASVGTVHPPDDLHENWYAVGDPSEAALVVMAMKAGAFDGENGDSPKLRSFPFDSGRKRMSFVRRLPEGDCVMMKGATDSILDVCVSMLKAGSVQPMTQGDRERIEDWNIAFSDQALRVFALAYRQLGSDFEVTSLEEIERDMVFLGLVGMIDPPRHGVREAMDKCHNAGIDIYMITGDHAATAAAIARDIGLARAPGHTARVVRGKEMGGLGDEELAYMMHSNSALIFSRVEPAHKLRVVRLLGEQGRVVAMTGDGINDAPALKRAHIGVAMGKTGVDVAKEIAEVVLLDDNFSTLVDAVEEGRSIYSNIRKVVLASLTTNIAELLAVLFGLVGIAVGNYAIPMLTIQILAIDLMAEILPLTFLCFDPPTPDDMMRQPRNRSDHILNAATGIEVGFFGSLIGVLSVANFFLYMHRHGLTLGQDAIGTVEYARASAMTWLTMAFCQFGNILSRRYQNVSIFNRNILTNKILLASIVISAVQSFAAVHAPGISNFLGFAPIGIIDWLHILGATALFLIVWEGLKWKRRSSPTAGE